MSGVLINMLWVRGELPWYAAASIRSFLYHGHRVRLFSYNHSISLPDGCEGRDASDILSEATVFGYRDGPMKGHYSGFADWFRYELLLKEGGWWSDTYVVCIAPFEAGREYLFASGWEPGFPRYVNNNVIYVRAPGTQLMRKCATVCRERRDAIEHAETGPVLLHRLVNEAGLQQYVASAEMFNPIQYGDLFLLMRGRIRFNSVKYSRIFRGLRPVLLTRNTKAVHLYAALFNKAFEIKSAREIPSGTMLSELLRKNGAL